MEPENLIMWPCCSKRWTGWLCGTGWTSTPPVSCTRSNMVWCQKHCQTSLPKWARRVWKTRDSHDQMISISLSSGQSLPAGHSLLEGLCSGTLFQTKSDCVPVCRAWSGHLRNIFWKNSSGDLTCSYSLATETFSVSCTVLHAFTLLL